MSILRSRACVAPSNNAARRGKADSPFRRRLHPAELKAIRNAGFRSVICNRPDGESPDQPAFDEIAAAARELGIEARYLPIEAGSNGDAQVDAFGALVNALPKPILAYCRTGNRAGMLWNRLATRSTARV